MKKIGLLALLFCSGSLVQAQALSGIDATMLSVDIGRADAAQACGLNKESIEAAMRIPLSNTPIQVREWPKVADGLFSTQINVLQTPRGDCAVAITVEFSRKVWLRAETSTPREFAAVWSRSYLLLGLSTEGIGKAATDKVEEFTKRFISAWLKDRQK